MEFVGNQINVKTVAVTMAAAFLVGRIHLFGDAFPAAVALMAVMMAVSTVYIYLVPVLALGMWSVPGPDAYGDMIAMAVCGVFFLFFHRQQFTIRQRTAIAATIVVSCKGLYYAAADMLYLLQMQDLCRELIALMIYIRVFNTVAKILFVGSKSQQLSGERIGLALSVFSVSLIGAIDVSWLVFPLWLMLTVVIQYCKGLQPAVTTAVLAMIFWSGQGNVGAESFSGLFCGMVIGWFAATWLEGQYRKTILALSVFGLVTVTMPEQAYGTAAAMGIMIACPPALLSRLWCAGESRFVPQPATEKDLRLHAIKRDLRKKRDAFSALGKLYRTEFDGRQIISYQFQGMARVADSMLAALSGNTADEEGRKNEQSRIPVGSASCAFEEVSGDSCLSFSFGKNQQALIISDGMGKGSRAREESRMVVTTLARLLDAGFDVDIAMKTVNGILMEPGGGDRFATVDLAIIDKETGRTRIFKMGAASTFVKRAEKVFMLKRPAPPAGITDGVKLEYIDVKLRKGELLVMVSDGVTDCDRQDPECQWLRQRLSQIGSRDPETVAELIVNKAAEKYGIRERDDLTVMVAAM